MSGVSNTELLMLRRTAASVMTPYAAGRSLSAVLAIHGDPTWRPATEASRRWATEVYKAANGGDGNPNALDLAELRRVWEACSGQRPANWRMARGPMDAGHLERARMGWKEDGPFNVVTDRGLKLCLIETPPPLMAKLMREAIQRVHEAGMIKGRPAEQLEEGCSRICVDHVRNALCSKRLRGSPGLASALTAVAGGTWTAERAHGVGYVVPEEAAVRPLCRAGPDSWHHRLWWCPASEEARGRICIPALVRAGRAAPKDSLLYTRALPDHPGDLVSRIEEGWGGPQ